MKWRNAKEEWPEGGETVAVLFQHWKKDIPLSYEVMFGEVCYSNKGDECFADTGDYTGLGGWGVYFKESNTYSESDDVPVAWMPAEEFVLPDWS